MHGMNDTQTVKHINSLLSLVLACVATLAALAGEIAGICDTWLSWVRNYLLRRFEIWL